MSDAQELPEAEQKRLAAKAVKDIAEILRLKDVNFFDLSEAQKNIYFFIYQAGMKSALDEMKSAGFGAFDIEKP